MAAKKGQPKAGGRTAGTPNRITADLRGFVKNLLEENMDLIKSDFDALESKERIVTFEKLLQYVIPRKREAEIEIENRTVQEKIIQNFFGRPDDKE